MSEGANLAGQINRKRTLANQRATKRDTSKPVGDENGREFRKKNCSA